MQVKKVRLFCTSMCPEELKDFAENNIKLLVKLISL